MHGFYLYPIAQGRPTGFRTSRSGKATSRLFTVTGGSRSAGHYSVDSLDVTKGTMDNITCYRFARQAQRNHPAKMHTGLQAGGRQRDEGHYPE